MAQYQRTVFNLSNGPGQAINDPRAEEARQLEASRRADRALNLQASAQAQQNLQAQRQADLQQEQMQTEAALSAQRSQGGTMVNAAMAQAMRNPPGGAGGSVNQFPAMGQDDMNRAAYQQRGLQDILSGTVRTGGLGDAGGPGGHGQPDWSQGGGVVANPAVPSLSPMSNLGAKQASWQNGLLADQTDPTVQLAGQKQAADIQDMLAKMGLAQRGQDAAISHQNFQEGLDTTKTKADIAESVARTGLLGRQTKVQEDAFQAGRQDVAYGRTEAEKARHEQALRNGATWVQTNDPGAFTSGTQIQENTGKLAMLKATDPETFDAVMHLYQNPEVLTRAAAGARQSWRSNTGGGNLLFDTNTERSDDAVRSLQDALSQIMGRPNQGPNVAVGSGTGGPPEANNPDENLVRLLQQALNPIMNPDGTRARGW